MCLATVVAQAQSETDSIKTETLPEVVVNADGQIEMADKTVLLPTALEKKHSANGFDLLSVMQTAELDVSPIAVGTGTWGIAAVIPKYLSLRLPDLCTTELGTIHKDWLPFADQTSVVA